MARSIHETRKSWGRLLRQNFSDSEAKKAVVQKALHRLWKKRRIKNAVLAERHTEAPLQIAAPIGLIPIRVDHDHSPLIYDGISPDVIRLFLQTMPPSFTEGVSEIVLGLGTEYMDEQKGKEDDSRDPYFGRISDEILPGLYRPPVWGTFRPKNGIISIYSFVWDQAQSSRVPAYIPEFYLRLHCLTVLVHELAHHHDEAHRIARGRWLSDRKENYEYYAEKMQWEWTQDYVFPYIETHYAKEWAEIRTWVNQHGGGDTTLELICGDPRYTSRDGCTRLATSTSETFVDLIKDVVQGKSLFESRLNFAWNLHYADEYERSLEVTTALQAQYSDNPDILSLHADTLEHLERYQESLELVERVLVLDPNSENAWKVKAFIMEHMKQWGALLETCNRWQSLPGIKKTLLTHRIKAVAFCALGRIPEMETELTTGFPKATPGDLTKIRASIYRRAGVVSPSL